MASEDGSIRLQDPSFNPVSWLPVYGRWCGPEWSAGERGGTKSLDELLDSDVLRFSDADGQPGQASQLDLICKVHDIDYVRAEGKPNEAGLKLKADMDLLRSISLLDQKSLPKVEQTYSKLMACAFAEKLFSVDLPLWGYELLKNGLLEWMASIEKLFHQIDGLTYTDQFGSTITGMAFDAKNEGLAYRLFGVTCTQMDGASNTWACYQDAFQAIHSFTPIANGLVVEAATRIITVMNDGSVLEQIGTSTPVTLLTPAPHPSAGSPPGNDASAPHHDGNLISGGEIGIPPDGFGDWALVPSLPFVPPAPPPAPSAPPAAPPAAGPDKPVAGEKPVASAPPGSQPPYYIEVVDPPGPSDLMGRPSPPIKVVGDEPLPSWVPLPEESNPWVCDAWKGPEFDDCIRFYFQAKSVALDPERMAGVELAADHDATFELMDNLMHRHALVGQEVDELVYAPVLGLFSDPPPGDALIGHDLY